MPRLCLAAAIAIALLTAVPATSLAAKRVSPATSPVTLASSVAARYWSAQPCGGRIKILAQQPVPTSVQRDADAWVTFRSTLGANNLTAPAATYTRCTVNLGRYRWPTTASMTQDWDMLCMTMTHEYGHLLGHAHDTTPGSVMNPVFTNYSNEPRLCRTTRPTGSQ